MTSDRGSGSWPCRSASPPGHRTGSVLIFGSVIGVTVSVSARTTRGQRLGLRMVLADAVRHRLPQAGAALSIVGTAQLERRYRLQILTCISILMRSDRLSAAWTGNSMATSQTPAFRRSTR